MDRRTFLRWAGLGALGLTGLGASAAGAQARGVPDPAADAATGPAAETPAGPTARPAAGPATGPAAVPAEAPATRPTTRQTLKHWHWTNVGAGDTQDELKRRFAAVREAGIGAVLIGGEFERACPLAKAEGLEAHAWIWTLCRADASLVREHPEWYAVSRGGNSTLARPPYVDYYKFLCPSREGVRRHLEGVVDAAAAIEALDGVHLDYVRYPDVILPHALWKKYGLVQNRELAQFDFCYCGECRGAFRRETGVDPRALPDPAADVRWRRFRWDSVTRLVNRLADVAHGRGKRITAAVFPTPGIARALVRQDWPRWDLDAVLPMVYHSFYDRPVAWIESAVRAGVAALPAGRPLFAGLYLPALESERDFEQAVAAALAGGARGVSLFGGVRQPRAG